MKAPAETAPRLVVHAGYPKAGSSSLKENFFRTSTDVNLLAFGKAAGGATPPSDVEAERLHRMLAVDEGFDAREASELWRERFVPFMRQDKVNVVSSEHILNNDIRFSEACERLQATVGRAKILIVVREHEQLLRSFYDMAPIDLWEGTGDYYAFGPWLEKMIRHKSRTICGSLFYAEVVAEFRRVFGNENVFVIAFEKLFFDPVAQAAFCRFFGFDEAEFRRSISMRAKNGASVHLGRHLLRRALRRRTPVHWLTIEQKRMLARMVAAVVPVRKSVVSESERLLIEREFGADMKALRSMAGPNVLV